MPAATIVNSRKVDRLMVELLSSLKIFNPI
jgi:hypothetical protein